MRRLPVYLLLDVSGSMSGEAITAVENGVQTMHSTLINNPNALETAYLSVITFSDSAQQVVPLTELNQFVPPRLKTGGTANLGSALKLVAECADREVIKTTSEIRGDWKPFVFIMTDGAVTGDIEEGLEEFNKRKWGVVVACGAGANADMDELKKITAPFESTKTKTAVLKMDTADSASYEAFFQWVTDSIERNSDKVEQGGEAGASDMLPPPPEEIQIL